MTEPKVCGVLLAAGLSRRFGGGPPKQLAPIWGIPQVRRIATEALASSLDEVVVVVGHRAGEIRRPLGDLAVRITDNPRYAEGQSSSVRAGLTAVREDMDAALFLTCDQPFLDREALDFILDAYRRTPAKILVPTYRGRRGSPVLFARELFQELASLEGDQGGRQLFAGHAGELQLVELPCGEPLDDFDTPEQLAALLAEVPSPRERR